MLRHAIPVDDAWHEIPAAVVAHVACRPADPEDDVQVWAEESTARMRVRVVATGQPWPEDDAVYLGTALARGGALVWHLIGGPVQ